MRQAGAETRVRGVEKAGIIAGPVGVRYTNRESSPRILHKHIAETVGVGGIAVHPYTKKHNAERQDQTEAERTKRGKGQSKKDGNNTANLLPPRLHKSQIQYRVMNTNKSIREVVPR